MKSQGNLGHRLQSQINQADILDIRCHPQQTQKMLIKGDRVQRAVFLLTVIEFNLKNVLAQKEILETLKKDLEILHTIKVARILDLLQQSDHIRH